MNPPVIVINYREVKNYPNHHVVNTTSRSTDWGRNLSPFLLGPVTLYDGHIAQNVENAWQFSKVYEKHTDTIDNPTQAYYDWAQQGWNDTYAHRYPMGKGAVPLYSLWKGNKLSYLEARREIYAPVYAKAVIQTDAFQKLLNLYQSGEPFVLVDFDAYDYLKANMSLDNVLDNPHKKAGHAFILAMLLQDPNLRRNIESYTI